MNRYHLLALVLAFGLARVAMTAFDVETHDPENLVQLEYCPMWQIWHDQKAAGIPIEQRNGWPDQAGRYFEECEQ